MNPYLKVLLVLGLAVVSVDVLAANAGMPWEGPIDKVVRSVQGPVAKGAGVLAISGLGLSTAMGWGEGIVKKGVQVGFGLATAFAALQWGLPMLGFGNGLAL